MVLRAKPILIYDGNCGFCQRWIERWRQITNDSIEYAPYQETAGQFPEIAEKEFESSVKLIWTDGKIYDAAEAAFRTLSVSPSHRWPLWLYQNLPGMRPASEFFYRFVASRRVLFSKISLFLWGQDVKKSRYSVSSALFTRFLGLIFFIAFASLGVQILGLIGSHGIVPVTKYLGAIKEHIPGVEKFWFCPTLAWLNASDGFLLFLCWAGAAFSLLIVLGIAPALFLFLCWFFYLSLFSVGSSFLSFQWDILLLETGFLAIFFALRFNGIFRFLLKLLLFKLMFLSGFVKLASRDATWRNLSALQYHFETQPLPVWVSWYVHHFPSWLLTFFCFCVFATELGVPFLIFMPRRIRHFAMFILIYFQIGIAATGNYTFFNLLTICLCLLLADDSLWPNKIVEKFKPKSLVAAPLLKRVIYPAAVLTLLANLGALTIVEPLHIANGYGLFAMMTTKRPEIIVEGSMDGKKWEAYEFKYKPGDLNKKPAFVAPHQPRLDWQMWFAALGNWRGNPWFISFCEKLLEGSPEVLRLLKTDPFSGQKPIYVRALFYEYHFTNPEEKRKTGAWWKRKFLGTYCPAISLRNKA